MPSGSRPGERRGGRKKGTLNKIQSGAPGEPAVSVPAEVTDAIRQLRHKKLAREVLEEFMLTFAGMAAYSQPRPKEQPQNPNASDEKFERYARLACHCAQHLAPYQSPTLRAIVVAPAPDTDKGEKIKRFTLTVFENGRTITPKAKPGGADLVGPAVVDDMLDDDGADL